MLRLLRAALQRLRRAEPKLDFAQTLRLAQERIEPVPVRALTLERALVSNLSTTDSNHSRVPHAGAK